MNLILRMSCAALLGAAACTLVACQSSSRATDADLADLEQWNHYGDMVNLAAVREPMTVDQLEGGEHNVAVTGEIVDVCTVKGCWMNVRGATGEQVFVKFKDYGFFVPRDAAGRTVVMRGNAVREVISVERLRHYAHDAGKTEAEIALITMPETQINFIADAVFVEGENLQRPYPETPVNNPDPGYVCD